MTSGSFSVAGVTEADVERMVERLYLDSPRKLSGF